jgi:hypothetical protein
MATAPGAFLFLLLVSMFSIMMLSSNGSPWSIFFLFISVWSSISNQPLLSRRDANRWLVLASGLFTLVIGAMLLVRGLLVIQPGDHSEYGLPRALLLIYSVISFVIGAAVIQECFSSTRVRERGIEMFSQTRPWSRVVVKDWQAREGGFALHLSILRPQGFFAMPLSLGSEIIVPVPASERRALEVFLAGHTVTAE